LNRQATQQAQRCRRCKPHSHTVSCWAVSHARNECCERHSAS
jgi:hypothetical protein